jgi:hypothetical protein
LFTSAALRGRTLDPMDNATRGRDDGMAGAIDELMAALDEPGVFRALVDAVEPAAIRTLLCLWGVRRGLYPAAPLPAPDARELVEFANRMESTRQ